LLRQVDKFARFLRPLGQIDERARRLPCAVPVAVWVVSVFVTGVVVGEANGALLIGLAAAAYFGLIMPAGYVAVNRRHRKRLGRLSD